MQYLMPSEEENVEDLPGPTTIVRQVAEVIPEYDLDIKDPFEEKREEDPMERNLGRPRPLRVASTQCSERP